MWNAIFQLLPHRLVQQITATYFKVNTWRAIGFSGVHSKSSVHLADKMRIRILPALEDNYMYMLIDDASQRAAVVDPVNPSRVLEAIQEEGVHLTHILTTHHHWDHAGGNEELARRIPGIEVVGGDDRIGALTRKVQHNDSLHVGNIHVRVLFTPCHTMGHVCYLATSPGQSPAVFTGDTLFVAGCGRFFEGRPEQMYTALVEILGTLPDDTSVFCGHEYTVSNLKFARVVEPYNQYISERAVWAKQKRDRNEPTVPSTIGYEKMTNPFMRVCEASVQEHAGQCDAIATMECIRREKDNFRG